MLSSGYIYILLWAALVGILSVMASGVCRQENVNGEKVRRVTPLFAVISVLPLVIWAGYRGNVGDTGAYRQFFSEMPSAFSGCIWEWPVWRFPPRCPVMWQPLLFLP